MANDEQFGSGVAAVFDAIASERKAAQPPATDKSPQLKKRDPSPPPPKKRPPSAGVPAEPPPLRTGRYPGTKNGPPKVKVTARITQELRAAYIDWSFDDRCPLTDLIERALTEFYQRHRGMPEKKE